MVKPEIYYYSRCRWFVRNIQEDYINEDLLFLELKKIVYND
jgi:hypothetical protein